MINKPCEILLVEDLYIASKLAILTLKALNCRVDLAVNGLNAIEMAKIKAYNIIFMDLGLPDIDGFTVAEMIRDHENKQSLAPTPIVALSAHSKDPILNHNCQTIGIKDFLVKPLTSENARLILSKYEALEPVFLTNDF